MKTTKLRGPALAAALLLAFTVRADAAPASRESLEALFQLTHADTMTDRMFDAMQKPLEQQFAEDAALAAASPARQKIQAKAHDDVMALMRGEFSWAAMEPQMIEAYQQTFTEEEVGAMINFYSTPAGQAMITKTPQLMQGIMAGSMARMRALQPQIRAIMEKARVDGEAADANAAHASR